jgi:lauroyl/myristoyl acyltransferase
VAAYLLWRLANFVVRRIPVHVSYRGAVLLADLVFLCWREKRENAIANMRRVLSDCQPSSARRAARNSFRNYGRYLVDFIRSPALPAEQLEGRIEFHQWPIIDAAFAHGRGVIFVLLHFGNWDWGAAVFSRRGYPLNVVAETFEHSRLNTMVVSARRTGGTRVLAMERGALPLLRALRRNEALAILIDRPDRQNGVPVRFFGATAYLPDGPARLALRTGARVIAVAVYRVRETSDRLRAEVDASVDIVPTGDAREDARLLTEAIVQAHERLIRCYPDQWYMFRRMWPETASDVAAPIPV